MTPLSRHGLAAAGTLLTIPLIVACTDNAPDCGGSRRERGSARTDGAGH